MSWQRTKLYQNYLIRGELAARKELHTSICRRSDAAAH